MRRKVEIRCQNTSIEELKQLAQRQSKLRDIAINRDTVSYLGFGRNDNKDSIGSGEKRNSNEESPGEQSEDKKGSGRKRNSGGQIFPFTCLTAADGDSSKVGKMKDCKIK